MDCSSIFLWESSYICYKILFFLSIICELFLSSRTQNACMMKTVTLSLSPKEWNVVLAVISTQLPCC
jgi:hypothetical protein